MGDGSGNIIVHNGEIYNYLELRKELGEEYFKTSSDTEVILHAYRKWGKDCVDHFRGMFSFALWDEENSTLFCARDRFGIKPFYYTTSGNIFYFASEIKALLPFVDTINTDEEGLKDYLSFQFCLDGKTLFKNIRELLPGHILNVSNGQHSLKHYWEVYYEPEFSHASEYFEEKVRKLIDDSISLHLRSDVPVGAYVSGGIDSGIVSSLASKTYNEDFIGFMGKFPCGPEYDESEYARELAGSLGFELQEIEITPEDFIDSIRDVIYHLDYPVAGPGSFPQYHVSALAGASRKVVLGGQGGDEIFGGYARYLLAYFEQCIKAAIDGTMSDGNFIVTYESIIQNLGALRNYKPMIREFWKDGLFEEMDKRYFRLINRANNMNNEIRWEELGDYSSYETFKKIFEGNNVEKKSYFDSMTHFDFKTLLPALLQVEDRMSMAHGLESRVPFLDHPLVELAATMPSDVKFKDGKLKRVLIEAMKNELPKSIAERKDKMGFPVPLNEWIKNELKDFVHDIFLTGKNKDRPFLNYDAILDNLSDETKFGRKIWGLLSLELWYQEFHDKHQDYKQLAKSVK